MTTENAQSQVHRITIEQGANWGQRMSIAYRPRCSCGWTGQGNHSARSSARREGEKHIEAQSDGT